MGEIMPPPPRRGHRHWFVRVAQRWSVRPERREHFHLCLGSFECLFAAMSDLADCAPEGEHQLVRLTTPALRQLFGVASAEQAAQQQLAFDESSAPRSPAARSPGT